MPALFPRTLAAVAVAALPASAGCGPPDPVTVTGATLRLTLSEYRIAPQQVRVAAGRITVVVRNAGTIVHQLAIRTRDGARLVAATRPLRPGETARLTIDLPRGSYRDLCPLDRHDTLGEHGTIEAR